LCRGLLDWSNLLNPSRAAVTEMLISILNCCTQEELEEADEEDEDAPVEMDEEDIDENGDNRSAIKSKILAVGRMSRVFALLREEAESGSELKSIDGVPTTSTDTLNNGAEEVKVMIKDFKGARTSDIENERLPPDMIDVRLSHLSALPVDRTLG
jgi:serine/threonine-protein phosphatase 2B catalytic subunit